MAVANDCKLLSRWLCESLAVSSHPMLCEARDLFMHGTPCHRTETDFYSLGDFGGKQCSLDVCLHFLVFFCYCLVLVLVIRILPFSLSLSSYCCKFLLIIIVIVTLIGCLKSTEKEAEMQPFYLGYGASTHVAKAYKSKHRL